MKKEKFKIELTKNLLSLKEMLNIRGGGGEDIIPPPQGKSIS